MLNYAGEAGNDSGRSTTVARLYTRVQMCNSAGTPCMGTDQLSDALTAACCVRSEAWYTALTKQCLDAKHLTPVDVGRD